MCDYSLYEFPNRLAREGEELVTYRFPLGSLGLVATVELNNAQGQPSVQGFWGTVRGLSFSSYRPGLCAICLPPGARLILKDISAGDAKGSRSRSRGGRKIHRDECRSTRFRQFRQNTLHLTILSAVAMSKRDELR